MIDWLQSVHVLTAAPQTLSMSTIDWGFGESE